MTNGLVPKNAYGNLDLYVSSMIPPGGAHILHPEASRAAKIIGVDYADAVTGFAFKGRHGTAITNGAVVALEYREAVEEVCKTFDYDRIRADEQRRSLEALRIWKRLLAGLRVRERIKSYDVEGEREAAMKEDLEDFNAKDDIEEEAEEEEEEAGGFLPSWEMEHHAEPTADKTHALYRPASPMQYEGGGFITEENHQYPSIGDDVVLPHDDIYIPAVAGDDSGGGFLVGDDNADVEDDSLQDTSAQAQGVQFTATAPDQQFDVQTSSSNTSQYDHSKPGSDKSPRDKPLQSNNIANIPPSDAATAKVHGVSDAQTSPIFHTREDEQTLSLVSSSLPADDHDHEESKILEDAVDPMTRDPDNDSSIEIENQPCMENLGPEQAMSEASVPASQAIPPEEEREVEEEGEESVGSDKGSLLSHDPDDEDAEPEWLA